MAFLSTIVLAMFLFFIAVLQYASGQGICNGTGGALGDNRYMQQKSARRRHAFFLNVADPAICSGNINSFKYCYYSPEDSAPAYLFNFAVYRESGSNSGSYNNISPVFVVERSSSDVTIELGDGDFETACVDFTVNDPVPVNIGDVLGACIFDPSGSTQQLDIVGNDVTQSSTLLRDENNDCSSGSLSPTVTPPDMIGNMLLHLYANIGNNIPTIIMRLLQYCLHVCSYYCILLMWHWHTYMHVQWNPSNPIPWS